MSALAEPVDPTTIVVVTVPPPAVSVNTADSGPGWLDHLDAFGSFGAALFAAVAIALTMWSIRKSNTKAIEDRREREAAAELTARETAAEQRRIYELGVLRELLDTVPAAVDDAADLAIHGAAEMVTHRQFMLLSLLPSTILPWWRKVAVAVGRGHGNTVVAAICNEAGVPATFTLPQRVRRLQYQECLEAISERTGGDVQDVAVWMARLDGKAPTEQAPVHGGGSSNGAVKA